MPLGVLNALIWHTIAGENLSVHSVTGFTAILERSVLERSVLDVGLDHGMPLASTQTQNGGWTQLDTEIIRAKPVPGWSEMTSLLLFALHSIEITCKTIFLSANAGPLTAPGDEPFFLESVKISDMHNLKTTPRNH